MGGESLAGAAGGGGGGDEVAGLLCQDKPPSFSFGFE